MYFEPESRPAGAFWADEANPSPMPQSPGILQGGGTPGGVAGPPEPRAGGTEGGSQRHSHSLLTPVGSADQVNAEAGYHGRAKSKERQPPKDEIIQILRGLPHE